MEKGTEVTNNGLFIDEPIVNGWMAAQFMLPIIVTSILALPVAFLLAYPIARGIDRIRRRK